MAYELTSEHYDGLAQVLAPLLMKLVADGFSLPFEVMGQADGQLVFCQQVDAYGKCRDTLDYDKPLRARFPLNVSVTDRQGNVWKKAFVEADLA
jgi:hypothetical protein